MWYLADLWSALDPRAAPPPCLKSVRNFPTQHSSHLQLSGRECQNIRKRSSTYEGEHEAGSLFQRPVCKRLSHTVIGTIPKTSSDSFWKSYIFLDGYFTFMGLSRCHIASFAVINSPHLFGHPSVYPCYFA